MNDTRTGTNDDTTTPGPARELARVMEQAEAGCGRSACHLGDLYREGRAGLRRDPRRAFRWYARSALIGDASGQNNLGACYQHGVGCDRDDRHALKWYRQAADQGHGTAFMNLGHCHLDGRAVSRDAHIALAFFRRAVECGEPRAAADMRRLEHLLEPGCMADQPEGGTPPNGTTP